MFMTWPIETEDGNPYNTADLFLLLIAMRKKGYIWKIYTNTRHPNELAIKIEYNKRIHYIYAHYIDTLLYTAIGQVLTS